MMLESDEVLLLVEIGFWALDESMYRESEDLFSALADIQTANPYPRIGLATLAYGRGRRDDAIRGLEEVLRDYPQAVFTRSLLAKFMKDCGRTGWEEHAHESLRRMQDGVAADLARAVLGVARQDAEQPASLPAAMIGRRV